MAYLIYHNPRCQKSRETLQILEDEGYEPEVNLYLEVPPSVAELRQLGALMGKRPHEFVRTNESLYKDHVKGKNLTDEELYEVMAEHPILIERPIVVKDEEEAVLARPPEEVRILL